MEGLTVANTGESYANQSPAGPHTIPVSATADSNQEYSFTIDGTALSSTLMEGDDINFVILREGANAVDNYVGDWRLYKIDFQFYLNL